jgi:phosphoribosylformylglycinamidine synthase
MIYKIVVEKKDKQYDVTGLHLVGQIELLGIRDVRSARFAYAYYLKSDQLIPSAVYDIAERLLADPVTETFHVEVIDGAPAAKPSPGVHLLEIALNHGVTDATASQVMTAVTQMGFDCAAVKLTRIYTLAGDLSTDQLSQIARKLLFNPVIEHIVEKDEQPFITIAQDEPRLEMLPVGTMTDDELMALSHNRLWLNLNEMRTIRDYYAAQKRPATDVEIETLAQTWSEHCSHKVFRARLTVDGQPRESFIKRIKKVTTTLNKPWCLSTFVDNSGVIAFDDNWGVCFKVETHNKPSSIEPFGGAHTGAGGVIRDIMGTGLGAKPVANTDVLCFAPPDMDWKDIPSGLLHPKRVMQQVVAGIEDYGNKMGIPTVNGGVCFSERFLGVPLVYAGSVGVIEKECAAKGRPQPGDRIVLIGGLTGRDGIHGATFSSGELTHMSETISSQSVQIGHPLVQKKALDALLDLKQERLFHAVTDCGGGGLSSSVGEMGNPGGVTVELSHVPLKYPLPFVSEYWISESQERMLFAVPPQHIDRFKEICRRHDVVTADIGEFTDNGKLTLRFKGKDVALLDMEFLHEGCPHREFDLRYPAPSMRPERFSPPPTVERLTEGFLKTLAHLDVCSKEPIARVYDHEVQGKTLVKPYMGGKQRGPSDGAVLKPIYDSRQGVIIANGINVRYGLIDPYRMGLSVVDEAVRQVVALGGSVEYTAILDNFSLPSPEDLQTVLDLNRVVDGLCEAAMVYGLPIISGKDSFYNQFQTDNGAVIAVPPVLLVSSISVIDDVDKVIPNYIYAPQGNVYIVGLTRDELEASCYFAQTGQSGTSVPTVDLEGNKSLYGRLHRAMRDGLVMTAHDCSDGGLAVAAAELVIGCEYGMEIDLARVPYEGQKRNDFVLFSESNGRLLVVVDQQSTAAFEATMAGSPCARIGSIIPRNELVIVDGGQRSVSLSGKTLYAAWHAPIAAII